MKLLACVAAAALVAGCSSHQQSVVNGGLLATEIMGKLTTVDVNAAADIKVHVNGSNVTLSGKTHDAAQRAKLVSAAQSIHGVSGVQDNITIERGYEGIRGKANDAQLAARVSAAIAGQAGVNVFHVTPSVHRGIVTLRGTVSQRSLKRTIENAARAVPGVRGVVDNIAVR